METKGLHFGGQKPPLGAQMAIKTHLEELGGMPPTI